MAPSSETEPYHRNTHEINELTKLLKKEQDAPNGGTSDRAKALKKQIGILKGQRTRDRKSDD